MLVTPQMESTLHSKGRQQFPQPKSEVCPCRFLHQFRILRFQNLSTFPRNDSSPNLLSHPESSQQKSVHLLTSSPISLIKFFEFMHDGGTLF
ncbi:hypothetical protein OIU78_000885, partial [Salix suchowensis]